MSKTAKMEFETGDIQKKNSILNDLGANIVIKDLKVSIDILEPLRIIKKGEQKFAKVYRDLEPLENQLGRDKSYIFESNNIRWGGRFQTSPIC